MFSICRNVNIETVYNFKQPLRKWSSWNEECSWRSRIIHEVFLIIFKAHFMKFYSWSELMHTSWMFHALLIFLKYSWTCIKNKSWMFHALLIFLKYSWTCIKKKSWMFMNAVIHFIIISLVKISLEYQWNTTVIQW